MVLKLEEVLRLVKLSRRTLFRRVKDGSFPQPRKVGRILLWRQAEVEGWVNDLFEAPRAG